jgi:hypothetical protein
MSRGFAEHNKCAIDAKWRLADHALAQSGQRIDNRHESAQENEKC